MSKTLEEQRPSSDQFDAIIIGASPYLTVRLTPKHNEKLS